MNREFQLVISVWQAVGDISFLGEELKKQVEQAIAAYNKKYNGFKTLKLIEITKQTIILRLMVIVPDSEKVDVSRAIAYFSKQLYHRHGWSRFSKIDNRLFTVVEKKEISKAPEVSEEEPAGYQVPGRAPSAPVDNDLKAARLKWLYVTRDYVNFEIKKLEAEGVGLRV